MWLHSLAIRWDKAFNEGLVGVVAPAPLPRRPTHFEAGDDFEEEAPSLPPPPPLPSEEEDDDDDTLGALAATHSVRGFIGSMISSGTYNFAH